MNCVNTPLPSNQVSIGPVCLNNVSLCLNTHRFTCLSPGMQYTEHGALDPLTDSDGDEFSKPEDGEGKQQYMFIWSPKFEVSDGPQIICHHSNSLFLYKIHQMRCNDANFPALG